MSTTWYIRIKPIKKLTKKQEEELRLRVGVSLFKVAQEVENKQDFYEAIVSNGVKKRFAEVFLLTDKEVKEV